MNNLVPMKNCPWACKVGIISRRPNFDTILKSFRPRCSGRFPFESLRFMPAISIDLNGVLKLLTNLKLDKAAGPDETKPVEAQVRKQSVYPSDEL